MRLSACLIKEELEGRLAGVVEGEGYHKPLLSKVRMYQGEHFLEAGYLYIASKETLEEMPEMKKGSCLLYPGRLEELPLSYNSREGTVLAVMEQGTEAYLNYILEIFEKYSAWEEEMQNCINKRKNIQSMIDACRGIFENPLFLCDQDYRFLALTGLESGEKETDTVSQDVMCSFRFETEFQKLWNSSSAFLYQSKFLPYRNLSYRVRCGGNYTLGLNLQESRVLFRESDRFLLEYLGEYIRLYYDQNYMQLCQNQEEKTAVLKGLITGKETHRESLQLVLDALQWEEDHSYQVYCLKITELEKKYRFVGSQCTQVEHVFQHAYGLEYEDCLVTIVNQTLLGRGRESAEEQLRIFIRENYLKTGKGRAAAGIRNIRASYLQAVAALETGEKKDPTKWYYDFEEYCLDYMIYNCTGSLSPKELVPEGLLRMKEYDRQNKTFYLQTLEMYYREKCNTSRAAEVLFIHRTTFLERLRRIRRFLCMDLDDPKNRIYLILSMEVLKNDN